jgi:hypothetical protein
MSGGRQARFDPLVEGPELVPIVKMPPLPATLHRRGNFESGGNYAAVKIS